MNRPIPFLLVAALALASAASARAEEPSFSGALQKQAGPIIEQLKKKGCTNVGVLKFLVRQGKDAAIQDDAGDINHSLANQTQRALILANAEPDFGIIEQPSAFVVKNAMSDANHRTEEGRKAFFAKKFELAWSRDKVEPSAFLIGTATIDTGLNTMVVQFQMFKADGKLEEAIAPMTVAPGPELLAQTGLSYTMPATRRKALVSGEKLPPEAQKEIVEEMKQSAPAEVTTPEKAKPFAPLADCPIKWVIRYNGKDVDVAGNSIPTPQPKDKVTFVLSNPTKETYGVVLLVNGESTLYQEKGVPLSCRKWILEPNSETTISGFQTSAKEALPFEVVAPDDARADSVRYGDHAGTFRMVVFLGTTTTDGTKIDKPEAKDDTQIVAMATRGSAAPTGDRPQTLRGLQAQLREIGKDAKNGRGFVVKGDVAELSETQQAYFRPTSETPVSDISLRYFKPKN